MAKATKKTKTRSERRFLPQSTHNPLIVKVLGALGAAALGAGLWGHFYGHFAPAEGEPVSVAIYIAAAGAVLVGAAIWLGTSSDAAVRVGDAGIALERGGLRRMPWWEVSQISWDGGVSSLVVAGKDEAGQSMTFKLSVHSQPDAIAWVVKEARARIPKKVDLADSVNDKLPELRPHAGTSIALEPMQVVGKHCAASKRVIAYEPEARVCPRCERVYHKLAVPKKCKCGGSLEDLRSKASATTVPEEPTSEDEAPAAPSDGELEANKDA